jgi:hypothetical protein
MSSYTITSPSIDAILSDDNLYFEGIRRPLIAYSVREDIARLVKSGADAGANRTSDTDMPNLDSHEHVAILERYASDLYSLFLKKLGAFFGDDTVSGESALKLQALLQEMIKVKGLIEAAKNASVKPQ